MSEEDIKNNQEESNSVEGKEHEYDFMSDISAFGDIQLDCKAILGSSKMSIGQFLKITRGSILELEQGLDAELAVLVNGYKIADGGVKLNEDVIGIEVKKVYKHKKH